MKTTLHKLTLVTIFFFVASLCNAQAGTLDSSFGVNGKLSNSFGNSALNPTAVAIQEDGKIVVTGIQGNQDSGPAEANMFTIRYTSSGIVDSSFGVNGVVLTFFDTGAYTGCVSTCLLIQPDQKIVIGGYAYHPSIGPDAFVLARILPNGNYDSSFGTNGKKMDFIGPFPKENEVEALALMANGEIIAAGGSDGSCLVRYKATGIRDSTFGTDGVFRDQNIATFGLFDVSIAKDGKIIAGGTRQYYEAPPEPDFLVGRFLSNGNIDSTFGSNGYAVTDFYGLYDNENSIVLTSDNGIVATGFAQDSSGKTELALLKYKANGSLDSSFGKQGKLTTLMGESGLIGKKILEQPNGKLIVAAQANSGNLVIVRFFSNGTIDSSFGVNGKSSISFGFNVTTSSAALQTDGKIVGLAYGLISLAKLKGESPTSISFKKNVSITEGNIGTTPAQFKIVLNQPSTSDVKVNYTTLDGTAKAGSDYIATSGTVTIKAGKTSKSILVNVIGDNVQERNEKFSLVLSNPQNAILGTPDTAVCTIKNDDPGLMLSGSSNESITSQQKIKIYPNPASEVITLEGLDANSKSTLSIIDADGKIIMQTTTFNSSYTINIKQLPQGTYFLKIESGNNKTALKFVKQ